VDGQLLQTNKKWSHLKEKQKTWMLETAKKEYDRFVVMRGKQPVHGARKALIEHIYDEVAERGIWIPFTEFSRVVSRHIAHWCTISSNAYACANPNGDPLPKQES
jgi:hypothetical protein